MTKILFVCHGNICRSPMAEFVMKHMAAKAGLGGSFHIASAATSTEELGSGVYPPARRKLAQHGIACDGKTARQMTKRDYADFDLLIGMDGANLRNMRRICGGDPEGKIHLLLDYTDHPRDVADPWYTGDFDATWRDVSEGCRRLLDTLTNNRKDETDMNLTMERARELNRDMVTEEHLILHSLNVCYAMEAMAKHFGADPEHWMAVGYLHDFDYEKYPDEHLRHTKEPLLAAGVSEEDVRAILSHGFGGCTDVEPLTDMEKSLYTVDELTGIIQAAARMRPMGITDLEVKSFMKKFKDKKFAAKCNRALILRGCDMLGMELRDVAEVCIEGMKAHAEEIGLGPRAE